MTDKPIRTALFTPADRPDRVAKAVKLQVDAVIVDLEDAVHESAKEAVRANLGPIAELPRAPGVRLTIRINAIGTRFARDDIASVALPGVDGVVLPMYSGAADVRQVDELLTEAEGRAGLAEGSIWVLPIVETALGLSALSDLREGLPRVRQVSFGAGDLSLDLGVAWEVDNPALLHAKAQLPPACRAAGLDKPLDSVFPQLSDPDGLRAESEHAARLGYGGKTCIHPKQLDVVRPVFHPSEQELAHARKIVAAFEEAGQRGLASIQVDGEFVDYPVALRAQQVLESA